jgi:hypothetical protein
MFGRFRRRNKSATPKIIDITLISILSRHTQIHLLVGGPRSFVQVFVLDEILSSSQQPSRVRIIPIRQIIAGLPQRRLRRRKRGCGAHAAS